MTQRPVRRSQTRPNASKPLQRERIKCSTESEVEVIFFKFGPNYIRNMSIAQSIWTHTAVNDREQFSCLRPSSMRSVYACVYTTLGSGATYMSRIMWMVLCSTRSAVTITVTGFQGPHTFLSIHFQMSVNMKHLHDYSKTYLYYQNFSRPTNFMIFPNVMIFLLRTNPQF